MKCLKLSTFFSVFIIIIVLLILAGVSISLVVGQNGVLTRATDSSKATKYSQMKEALGLAIEDCQTEYFNKYVNNAGEHVYTYINVTKLNSALNEQGYKLYKDTSLSAVATDSLNSDGATETVYIADKNGTSKDYVAAKITLTTIGASVEYGTALNTDISTTTNP